MKLTVNIAFNIAIKSAINIDLSGRTLSALKHRSVGPLDMLGDSPAIPLVWDVFGELCGRCQWAHLFRSRDRVFSAV